ncbi:MAG: hypothetical protein WAN51_01770 [Alphaproteobacteria bacterium]
MAYAAVVKLPDLTDVYAADPKSPQAGRAGNPAYIVTEDLDDLTCALQLQSRYSKWAAFYAGVAAALQAIVIVLQM